MSGRAVKTIVIIFLLLFSTSFVSHAKPSKWAEDAYAKLVILGISEGDLANSGKLQVAITRREFCELIVKFRLFADGTAIQRYKGISPFDDVDDKYVTAAYKLGIVRGISETEFKPSNLITREQIAAMISRTLTDMNLLADKKEEFRFNDDKLISEWAKTAVYLCKQDNIVAGVDGGNFAPKKNATREQVMKMLDNALIAYKLSSLSPVKLSKSYNSYVIPGENDTNLIYSSMPDRGINLRITSPVGGGNSFDIDRAALEVYTVVKNKYGEEKAKALSAAILDRWSFSDVSFIFGEAYYVNESAELKVLSRGQKADMTIRFDGDFSIDLAR